MLWCNTGRLTTSSQLCADALQSIGGRIYLLLQPVHAARTGMRVATNVVKWSALSLIDATDCFVAGKITGMLLDHYKDPSEVPYV